MQHLASEFSKIVQGCYPRTLTGGGGGPLQHPTSSPARAQGALVGTQTMVPLNFSAVFVPLRDTVWHQPE